MASEEIRQARAEKGKLTISCKISYRQNEQIKEYCIQNGITKNQLCYNAIMEYIENHNINNTD